MPKLIHILTVADSLVFLAGQVEFMQQHGWQISVVTSAAPELGAFGLKHGVDTYEIEMPRRISPLRDLQSLSRLRRLIHRLRPDIVHAHTPKGGLLGTLAASLATVRSRIYHMRGLPMMTASGARRHLLRETERVSCAAATRVLANSESLRDYAIEQRLCPSTKIAVLGKGSGNGVDCDGRFSPVNVPVSARGDFRRALGIEHDAHVIGYLGRLVRDKGIADLVAAWSLVKATYPQPHLVVAGKFETRDALPEGTREALSSDPRIHLVGFVEDTPRFLVGIDQLVLPTYREGFPNVLLEASSMQVPIVATRVPGCTDAVVDGVTGLLVPPRNPEALASAISRYIADDNLRRMHGKEGRKRTVGEFRRERLWAALLEVYEEELAGASRRNVASS